MFAKITEANELNQIKTAMVKSCGTPVREDVYGVLTGKNANTCEGISSKVGIDILYPVINDKLPLTGWWNFKWVETVNDISVSTRIIEYSTDYDADDESAATWTRVAAGADLSYDGAGAYRYIGAGNNGSSVAVAIPSGLKAVRVRLNDGTNNYSKILPIVSSTLVQELGDDLEHANGFEYETDTALTIDETLDGILYTRGPLIIQSNVGEADAPLDYGAAFIAKHSGANFFAKVTVNLNSTTLSEDSSATKRISGLILNAALVDTWYKNNARAGLKRNAATRLFAYERFGGEIQTVTVTGSVDLTTNYVVKMYTNKSGTFAAVFTAANAFIAGIADWGNNNMHPGMGPLVNNNATINNFSGYKF